ncbi:MAG: response regulator [Deltaproteobacteria bacterium]|nr:response regulator [Deltaproteobacteria bacterium]
MASSLSQEQKRPEVLVVDDTPASLQLLTGILQNEGYVVRPASSGSLALQSVTAKAPDLILLDVKMPGIDGYEVCRRLKDRESSRTIPVIFISALDELMDKVRGFEAGAVDYITKPFQSGEVLARVKTHLELRRLQSDLERANVEMEERVRRRTAELASLNEALQASERNLNIRNRIATIFLTASDEEMYEEVLKAVLDELNSRYGAFGYLADDPGAFLHVFMERVPGGCRRIPDEKKVFHRTTWGPIWKQSSRDQQIFCSNEPLRAPRGHRAISRALNAPIIHQEKPIGNLSVANKENDYDENDQALLETIASHIAPILHARLERDRQEIARKKAEENLNQQFLFLQQLIDTIPNPIYFKDAGRIYRGCNKAMEEFLGVDRDKIIGKSVHDIYSKELADIYDRKDIELLDHPGIQIYESLSPYRDGTRRNVVFNRAAYCQPDGTVRGLIGVVVDITDYRQTEEALRGSEERLKKIQDSLNIGIVVIDSETRKIFDINRAAGEMIGAPTERIIGTVCHKYLCPGAKGACPIADLGREMDNAECALLNESGVEIPILKTVTAMTLHGRKYFLESFINIAEQKKLELTLAKAQKMEAIGTLAGGIAHDFNNILSTILGFAELAKMQLIDGGSPEEDLDEVLGAGLRARDLIAHILTFSRLTEIERQPIEIVPLVKETVKFLKASLPATVEIRTGLAVSNSAVVADPTQIHQVLMNLCTNAFHAMEGKDGVLFIELKEMTLPDKQSSSYRDLPSGEYLQLSVSDTGHGIPKNIIDRIFDPFFTTKQRGEGTGMGLSIIHGIVKDMGGAISVDSKIGKGTTFHVLFPKHRGDTRKLQNYQSVVRRGKGKILFVDDEKNIVIAGRRLLERTGYDVVTTTSSLEAYEIFKNNPGSFDLVMTDMTMPKMNGIELSKKLLEIRPDIPVILSTGFSAGISRDMIADIGIRQLVMKPMIISEIAHVIEEVLTGRGE